MADPDSIFRDPVEITEDERREAVDYIRLKMTPQPLKVRADVQVTCFAYDGIEAIRAALLAGQALSTEAVPIKVQLIAPPLYVMLTTTLDKAAGIAALTAAIDAMRAVLEARGGRMVIKTAPTVTTQQDEGELARLLQEGEGDDDEDDDDDKGEEDNEEGMGSGDLATGIVAAGADGGVEGEAAREAADSARRATAAAAALAAKRQLEEAARAKILAQQEEAAGRAPSNAAAAAGPAAAGGGAPAAAAAAVSADAFAQDRSEAKGDAVGEMHFSGKKKKKVQVAASDE